MPLPDGFSPKRLMVPVKRAGGVDCASTGRAAVMPATEASARTATATGTRTSMRRMGSPPGDERRRPRSAHLCERAAGGDGSVELPLDVDQILKDRVGGGDHARVGLEAAL